MLALRKLLLVALAAIGAMAFTASAAAQVPYDDTSLSEWNLAEIHNPEVLEEAESTNSILFVTGLGDVLDCHVDLEATAAADGSIQITNVTVTPGDPACETIVPNEEPWQGQICEYEHSSNPMEFWLRLDVHFFSGLLGQEVQGAIFADVTGGGAALVDSVIGAGPAGIRANGAGGSAPYVFNDTLDLESTEELCTWPELS